MALVKGSKKKRVKVIEYRLRAVVGYILTLVVCMATLVAGTYFFGHKLGMSGQEQALKDVERLTVELKESLSEAQKYEQQLENSKTASEVDRQASEGVRQQVIELKDEIARLNEENSFYRGLMAPNEKSSGLTLGAVELVRARGSEAYSYKVVIQQLAARHNLLNGFLTFTVVGRLGGVETRYPLMNLTDSVKEERVRLRFKYFQVIEGELALPEGFEPEGVEIEAVTTGKKPQNVTKKFGWLVEEI